MHSIPAAMTWEIFDRGRWSLPAAALGALAFPVIIFSALAHEGALDPRDRSVLIMHLVMVQMNIAMFGGILIGNGWKMWRLYAYPASTATLVTWRLLPAMAAMGVETVTWTAALNAMFHLDWPLWGPALLSAIALAAVEAAVWLTEKSRWVFLALTVVGAVLGFWFRSRYGGAFGDPMHPWDAVTPTEVFTLLAIAGISWRLAIVGVARNRRGEPPFSFGLIAWLERVLDRAPSPRPRFRTPAHAQFWYEWRNGWLAPAVVAGVLFVGFVSWQLTSRDPQELVEGVGAGSLVLLCAALVSAAVMGNVSPTGDLVMSQFLAARPLTTADLAHTILRAAAASLLLAWAVWAAALVVALGIFATLGAEPSPSLSQVLDWRQIPATLLGSWIIMGCFMSIILTGRSRPFIQLFAVLMAAYIAFMLYAKFALSPKAHEQVTYAVATAIGAVFFLGTIWAFAAGRRRGLVDAATAWAAFATWAALVVVGVLMLPPIDPMPRTTYVILIGVLALAVAPLAAAPLALAWNRNR